MATSNDNNMKIEQVKTAPHEKRVATHSHIRGLGLRPDGTAEPIQSGFVGQENAREVSFAKTIRDGLDIMKSLIMRFIRQVASLLK